MKCSICRQEGHNKRSCKKTTTAVSVPTTTTTTTTTTRVVRCGKCGQQGHTAANRRFHPRPVVPGPVMTGPGQKIDETSDENQQKSVKMSDSSVVSGSGSDSAPESATAMNSIHNMLIHIIQNQKEKEEKQDIWKDSPYKDLVKLQSNNVGNVGELLLDSICKAAGILACCDGSKTKQIGGGEGDGKILNIAVEVKTAHQGSTSPSFQHELGEVPWKGSKYMIFVDIAPNCIYLTIFKNFEEATYKSKEKLPCFPTKTVTWRKEKGAFKLDTSVKINEESVKNGHAVKITPDTPMNTVASFIRTVIV
jgi:hypothetical protein